jgi:hypothetical protein
MKAMDWTAIYAVRARAREVQLETQELRWWVAQTRQRARLTCLARSMPGANRLTLMITAALLTERGLLDAPPMGIRRRGSRDLGEGKRHTWPERQGEDGHRRGLDGICAGAGAASS